jgi:hypothetical protein
MHLRLKHRVEQENARPIDRRKRGFAWRRMRLMTEDLTLRVLESFHTKYLITLTTLTISETGEHRSDTNVPSLQVCRLPSASISGASDFSLSSLNFPLIQTRLPPN